MRRLASPSPDLLLAAVDTPPTAKREAARRLARQALRQLLAEGLSGACELLEASGQPLRLAGAAAGIGLSVSHEVGLSLVAVHFAGPVGIDLLHRAALPGTSRENSQETAELAGTYLGPEIAEKLRSTAAPARQAAFAAAWTAHEAALKCLGLPLQEWTPALATDLTRCVTQVIDLAGAGLAGYRASLATVGRATAAGSRST